MYQQKKSAVALGVFDGVHIGHQKVLGAAAACTAQGNIAAVFTFATATIPQKHGQPLEFLCTDQQKQTLLESCGIQQICSLPFPTVSELDGETFCRKLLVEELHAERVFCGTDFRFGNRAAWNTADLRRFGEQMGFTVETVAPVELDGGIVSSSRIRELLRLGQPEAASRLLGRAYALQGVVQHGAEIGRTIQFPTLNLAFASGQLIPRYGVYATKVTLADGSIWKGVTNIGVKPTVTTEAVPVAETHLISFSGDLYGTECSVELLHFLRPEQKFDSLTALKGQIAKDLAFWEEGSLI